MCASVALYYVLYYSYSTDLRSSYILNSGIAGVEVSCHSKTSYILLGVILL